MEHGRNIAGLLARVVVGVIMIMHGWQKFFDYGIGGATAGFAQMGVPLPGVSAVFAATVELVGGAALIVGIGLPVVGVLMAIDMAGAFVFAKLGAPLIAPTGGQLELALLAGGLLAGFAGGAYSLDRVLFRAKEKGVVGQTVAA
ncbi:DoxX family protein [Kutzneria sp. NPDC052558]|uniref:DoxX family protein n=1 Tax=Kutzneria sp. NPDC052558 TaxID=3364121 RepID=UPI0037C890D5